MAGVPKCNKSHPVSKATEERQTMVALAKSVSGPWGLVQEMLHQDTSFCSYVLW